VFFGATTLSLNALQARGHVYGARAADGPSSSPSRIVAASSSRASRRSAEQVGLGEFSFDPFLALGASGRVTGPITGRLRPTPTLPFPPSPLGARPRIMTMMVHSSADLWDEVVGAVSRT
jgi:hypothetical protein